MTFAKTLIIGLVAGLLAHAGLATAAAEPLPDDWWVTYTANGELQVHFYFFWSRTCPHCNSAHPFIAALNQDYPWLILHSHDITADMAGALRYRKMAKALGQEAQSVPAFLVCGVMTTGYDQDGGMGRYLRELIENCYRQHRNQAAETLPAPPQGPAVHLPLVGAVAPEGLSLPVLTVVLAGLDAFNPCAFFVLLFLLSLLVHARQRKRMLLIGGIFIFFSGFIYFIFMAAWLNVFLLIGHLQFITLIAGLLAVTMGLLNVKDYFWFQRGPSLSIADQAKPGLFRRMRNLATGEHLPSLMVGAITLAIAANSYELLCTAGFPMVYTRTLTLHGLPAATYYLYLAAYNTIYILPLLFIMLIFAVTLGARKLKESEGRTLKLLSGNMMLALGLMLLVYPEGLNSAGIAALALLAALGLSGATVGISRLTAVKQRTPG